MTAMAGLTKALVIYVATAEMTPMSSVMVRIMTVMVGLMKAETFYVPRVFSVHSESVAHPVVEMYLAGTNVPLAIFAKKIPASVSAQVSAVLKGRHASQKPDHVETYAKM